MSAPTATGEPGVERVPAPSESGSVPELRGLVLAGGDSRRMGRDKGALRVDGRTQVSRAYELLRRFCARVGVSVRSRQVGAAPYAELPLVVDDGSVRGPAAGLLAAWAADPSTALCVLAVDMARVDAPMLERLIGARDPSSLATAFVHADGTPEPLCTIWEPAARGAISERAEGAGISLRRVLERGSGRVRLIETAEPERLDSVNEPADLARLAGVEKHSRGREDAS